MNEEILIGFVNYLKDRLLIDGLAYSPEYIVKKYIAELKQAGINTVLCKPASDGAEGAAVGQRSVGTNAEGEDCINVHNLSIREFGKCLKCGSTTRREAPSGGHL
jgi:hypothetical protein